MSELKVVTELPREKWSEFVYNHPQGNIFQTPEMHDVWKRTRNNEPFLLAVADNKNKIHGLLQGVIQKEYSGVLGRFTARSIVWGGPLVIDDTEEILNALLQNYVHFMKRKAIYSQFRNLWKQEYIVLNCFEKSGFKHEDHLNIVVDLTKSQDELWKDVHSKRRNEIRRAKKEGTNVRKLTTESEIMESYRILKEVYHNARVPLHDLSLFQVAKDILYPLEMDKYFGAFNQGKLIGTIFVLCYKDRVYDWYAGSLREYYHLYPNDLLPWEVFLWAKSKGYKVFDFGGAGKPDIPYGVRDYKKKFGGVFVNFGRFERINNRMLYNLGRFGIKVIGSIKRRKK